MTHHPPALKAFFSWFITSCLVLTLACQQKPNESDAHENMDKKQNSGNQALYDQVMGVHDEVMPKMNDIYKAKMALKEKLANTPGITESEKNELTAKIAKLDSAGESMMIWMRQFNPLPDSLGEDKARAYLESELVKVNKVKENIANALQKADSK